MIKTERIICSLCWNQSHLDVGELVINKGNIAFRYHTNFLKPGFTISPFKLPMSSDLLLSNTQIFDGLFGVFDDSLPDGWGGLLLDRILRKNSINLNSVTSLDRLSLVGNNGQGALCYRPALPLDKKAVSTSFSLDQIADNTEQILQGLESVLIEQLFQLGGSSGGARPKVFVGYDPTNDLLLPYQEYLPKNYEHWIIKFSATSDYQDIAQIEYAYYLMSQAAGIPMSTCRLFTGQSGRQYFGTKRFDRIQNQRLHLHSAAGLMHDNFRLSNMDYGHLMDAAFRLENDVRAYEKVLRLAAFNVYANNRDDHSKNFAFLMDSSGRWQMAPAYDLTFSTSAHGHHSTTIAGAGESPGEKDLLKLAELFSVDRAKTILQEVKDAIQEWQHFAQEAGVTKSSTKFIQDHLITLPT